MKTTIYDFVTWLESIPVGDMRELRIESLVKSWQLSTTAKRVVFYKNVDGYYGESVRFSKGTK